MKYLKIWKKSARRTLNEPRVKEYLSHFIKKDFDLDTESEAVKMYMEHHLEELEQADINKLFGTTEVSSDQFLSKLALCRVGIYPDSDEDFAVFDISLPEDVTDYLLVVRFSVDGEISYISMES